MRIHTLFVWAGLATLAVGCATTPSDTEVNAKAAQMMKASFKEDGQAKLDRLHQNDTQRLCSLYAGNQIPKDVLARIEAQTLASIKYPADGKLVGDWKNGE